jgi:aminoglycoside phosphotransferase (APT) family kinase protein
MTGILPAYADAIAAVRPDLASAPKTLHTRGWDSDAVEAGGTIFKFPKRPEAIPRLRREARLLALVRPRVPIAVPDMRLHETPRLFSEHAMIAGTILEAHDYEALEPAQQDALADALAAFYAALHAIPVADAVAAGVEAKPEWPAAVAALPVLARRLPAALRGFATRTFAAYEALPDEPPVLGYFDGHGWNMAFDRGRGVLNGLYDFADAGIGPRTRDFTYSNLTSGDLTGRLIIAYERRTGRGVDRRAVLVRTAVHLLSEVAEADEDEAEAFLASLFRWHDFMQSQPNLRI